MKVSLVNLTNLANQISLANRTNLANRISLTSPAKGRVTIMNAATASLAAFLRGYPSQLLRSYHAIA